MLRPNNSIKLSSYSIYTFGIKKTVENTFSHTSTERLPYFSWSLYIKVTTEGYFQIAATDYTRFCFDRV